ncbi:MAG: DUF3108 domain-containing protein [Deltaproteobacteria bacterium]|nr:DUF3108 domain-containing protein [Deltaproteobacteria bacterium]
MNKAILCLLASFLAQTLIFAVMPVQALSTKDRIPFHAGEKLSYVLKWSIIPVGEATLEVLNGEMKTGESAYLLKVSVKSYPIIDLFYRVRDHIESYVDRSVTHSLLYRKKQHEGRHERDIMVNFDWDKAKAHYYNKGKHERSVNILPGTFDPLSVFYAFRLYPLKDGLEVETPVTDGKKCVMGSGSQQTIGAYLSRLKARLLWVISRQSWSQQRVFSNSDGFAKSPYAALRFIPALLNSRYARRQSRFNRVNHCDVR